MAAARIFDGLTSHAGTHAAVAILDKADDLSKGETQGKKHSQIKGSVRSVIGPASDTR